MQTACSVLMLFCGTISAATAQGPGRRSAELDRLGFLVGDFRGEVQYFVSDTAPPLKGTMNFRAAWELDSAWVVARYEQSSRGPTLRGLLLYTHDRRLGRYLFYGVPNTPMDPSRMTGSLQGAQLVFETEAGRSPAYRETWELHGDTLVTTLSYQRAGQWVLGSRAAMGRQPAKP